MVEPTPIVERELSGEEASAQLAADGPNELPRSSARPAWKIMGEVLREPMFMLLLAGGGVYLLLGSKLEAIILLGFTSFSIVLTVITVLAEHSIELPGQGTRHLAACLLPMPAMQATIRLGSGPIKYTGVAAK